MNCNGDFCKMKYPVLLKEWVTPDRTLRYGDLTWKHPQLPNRPVSKLGIRKASVAWNCYGKWMRRSFSVLSRPYTTLPTWIAVAEEECFQVLKQRILEHWRRCPSGRRWGSILSWRCFLGQAIEMSIWEQSEERQSAHVCRKKFDILGVRWPLPETHWSSWHP